MLALVPSISIGPAYGPDGSHERYDVFCTVKECSPSTPVILMTGFGYDPHHSIVRSSQEGLHSFLFKPFKAKQLLAEVRKAFQKPAAVT